MGARLPIAPDVLVALCRRRRRRIRKLSLFGSQLKGTARPESDIDLLVEFEPDSGTTYFNMAEIEIELSEHLGSARA